MEIENYGDMVNREKEQAERILNDFLTAAKEIKKICQAHDQCEPQCPLYDKENKDCFFGTPSLDIDTSGLNPWEWEI